MGKGGKTTVTMETPVKSEKEKKKEKKQKKEKMSSKDDVDESKVVKSEKGIITTEIPMKSEKEGETKKKAKNEINKQETNKRKNECLNSQGVAHESSTSKNEKANNAVIPIQSEKQDKSKKKHKKENLKSQDSTQESSMSKAEKANSTAEMQIKPENHDQPKEKKRKIKISNSGDGPEVQGRNCSDDGGIHEPTKPRDNIEKRKENVNPKTIPVKQETKERDSLKLKSAIPMLKSKESCQDELPISSSVMKVGKNVPGPIGLVLSYVSRNVSESALNEFVEQYIVDKNDAILEGILSHYIESKVKKVCVQ